MVYTASSRWLIVNLGTISHTLLNLLFNIGKSFTVKATKNKQTNQQKTSYYLFDEKISIEEKSNSFTFLPYDSFYPPTMAVFGNFCPKNICCSHQKP